MWIVCSDSSEDFTTVFTARKSHRFPRGLSGQKLVLCCSVWGVSAAKKCDSYANCCDVVQFYVICFLIIFLTLSLTQRLICVSNCYYFIYTGSLISHFLPNPLFILKYACVFMYRLLFTYHHKGVVCLNLLYSKHLCCF